MFSMGASWGSFGILLPIAGDMAAATDIHILLPALAAVLVGSVFGDHCFDFGYDDFVFYWSGSESH